MTAVDRAPPVLLAGVLVLLALSGVAPQTDRLTWLLETAPVMIGIDTVSVGGPMSVASSRRCRSTVST